MPSTFLAFSFVIVMLGLSLMNRSYHSPREFSVSSKRAMDMHLQAGQATMLRSEIKITPSPPSVSPSLVLPTPSPQTLPIVNQTGKQLRSGIPSIHAAAYLLWSEKDGLLLAHNINASLPIASVTKLMTALVFVREFPESGKLTISQYAASLENSAGVLKAGDVLAKDEALRFLLIASSNAVAQTISEYFGHVTFLQKMNERAASLDMTHTYFADPSGLNPSSRSSVRDLLTLSRAISSEAPEIFDVSRIAALTLVTASGRTYQLRNTNTLLGVSVGIVGGKTGYTDAAGGCLVLVFEKDDTMFVAVVLGSPDRFGEMQKLIEYAYRV